MTDAAAADIEQPEEPEPKQGGVLGAIERLGDKVPHPAIIFLALCAIVVVLSHILYLFDVSATQEVAEPVPVEAEVNNPAGSVITELAPADEAALYTADYEIHTETIPVKEPADRRRHPLTTAASASTTSVAPRRC